MEDKSDIVSTPNVIKTDDSPHLTDAEIESYRRMNRAQNMIHSRAMFYRFLRLPRKPKSDLKPLTFNEKGEVVENLQPREAPVGRPNLKKGNLRNKKCSCGSGRKFKNCCLTRKYGE